MTSRRLAFLALAVMIAGILIMPPPAFAREFPPIIIKGRSVPVIERNYPALTPTTRSQGTGAVNRATCMQATFCDTVRLEAAVEGLYPLYSLRVTLTWPNPKTPANPTGCDLTLGVWERVIDPTTKQDNPDPTVGRVAWTGNNLDVHPEILEFGQDDPNPQTFWILVNHKAPENPSGTTTNCEAAGKPQAGYTLRAEFAPISLEPLPDGSFRRVSAGGFSSGSPSAAARFSAVEEPLTAAESEASAEALKLPGPDGEMSSQELPLYLQAQQRREDPGGRWLVTSIVVLAVAAAGLFVFFRLRARRAAT